MALPVADGDGGELGPRVLEGREFGPLARVEVERLDILDGAADESSIALEIVPADRDERRPDRHRGEARPPATRHRRQ